MKFSSVLGHPALAQSLRALARTQRLPHAQLFLGPEGCGKLTMALALAQYAICLNPSEEDSCGTCSNCVKAEKWIHPDIHFSFPTVGAKETSETFLVQWRQALAENPYQNATQWLQRIATENKQGNITKDECVRIVKKLSLKAFESPFKILIMWLPEYLGREGNRLLKLIEEPPENTLFFLVAENQELILNTILSRCQLVKFNALPDEAIVEGLQSRLALNETQAQSIALLADGNFNEALDLVAKTENDLVNLFLDWLRVCYGGDGVQLVTWSEKLAGLGREGQKHLLRYALHFFQEYMLLKIAGKTQLRLRPSELETAQKMTRVIEFDQLEPLVDLMNQSFFHVERNANPKILFLHMGIQMHQILRRKTTSLLAKAG